METEKTLQPPFTKEYLCSKYDYKDGALFLKDGKPAHGMNNTNKWYKKITIDGQRYGVHRIILFYHTGQWGNIKNPVDHIDGNILNNRIENLQLIPLSSNVRKGKIRSNNTTGATGVVFHKEANKYMAQVRLNRKFVYLGLYSTVKEANEAVVLAKLLIEMGY